SHTLHPPPLLLHPSFSPPSADHPHLHSFPTRRSSDLQLLERQPAHLGRLALADCAAVHRAQEIIQQSLPGRRVVEHVADERRLRSEEHTSELQSPYDLVCRLLLEKKKKK